MGIIIEEISFLYNRENVVIADLSLMINNNEIISIIGNSGCGKSTLLNLISGLLKPQSGTITVKGSIAYLTQAVTLLPYKTAFENCLLAVELRKSLTTKKVEQANELFSLFNLDNSAKNKFPNELSGGMKQRIGLIQTMLIDTDFYLLDEPFNAIDRNTTLNIQHLLWQKCKTQNLSAVIVTHDLNQIILTSDKVVVMKKNEEGLLEICFCKDFTILPPIERQNSKYYNEYALQIINSLNDE